MSEGCNCPYHQKHKLEYKKDGRCESFLQFYDDYGDNEITFHCELPLNHDGSHQETGLSCGKKYTVEWNNLTKTEFAANQDQG